MRETRSLPHAASLRARVLGRVIAVAMGTLLSMSASSRAVAAVPKSVCVQSNLASQEQRRADHFAAERASLATCTDPSCPAVIRNDCSTRLEELRRVQPSLVFEVKDERGDDLLDVTVTLDGATLTSRLDGRAADVDPGPHVIRFDAAGRAPVVQQLVVNEGETDRRVVAVLAPATGQASGPVAVPAVSENGVTLLVDGEHTGDRSAVAGRFHRLGATRIAALAIGGAGVGLLAFGAGYGLAAKSAWDRANSVCGGNAARCNSVADTRTATGDRTSAETDAALSTVGFIAGGVLLAAGGVLFFTAGSGDRGGRHLAWTLAPALAPKQAGLDVVGSF